MQEVRLKLNGKDYTKTIPDIEDWLWNQELTARMQGKNALIDKDGPDLIIETVAKFLGVNDKDTIIKQCDLAALMKAYRTIQANIVECFLGKGLGGPPEGKKQPQKK